MRTADRETDRERAERLLGLRRFHLNQQRFRVFGEAVADFGRRRHIVQMRGWQPGLTVGCFGLTTRQLTSLRVHGRPYPGPALPHLDHWTAFTKHGRLAAVISWPYADPEALAADLAELPDRLGWAVVVQGPACSVYPTSPVAYIVVDREVLGDRPADLLIAGFTSTTKWSLPVALRQLDMADEMAALYPPKLTLVA